MIDYKMMDSSLFLTRCLHGGPVPVETAPDEDTPLNAYVRECINKYGSSGVLALDGDKIIGLLRFYPDEVFDMMDASVCVHKKSTTSNYKEIDSFPSRDELESQHLRIECMQLVTNYYSHDGKDYGQQGIGKQMLKTLIQWAEENNWEKISFNGINLYTPVLHWTGFYPKDSLISLGFDVNTVHVSDSLKEGISNQIEGFHGKEIQEIWKEYGEVDVDEAAEIYDLTLTL